jgi:hypothetical protein
MIRRPALDFARLNQRKGIADRQAETIAMGPRIPAKPAAYDSLVWHVMDDVIRKLTAEQAFEVVLRLHRRGGKIRKAVAAEAMSVLTEIDLNEIGEEVLFALDGIDVEDCWNRSGRSRYGYTSPDEAAGKLIEGALRPFLEQFDRYHDLDMADQEASYCMGVMLGCYRFEQESKSEFRQWSVDILCDIPHLLVKKWQKRTRQKARINTMRKFVRERCPQWAKWLSV